MISELTEEQKQKVKEIKKKWKQKYERLEFNEEKTKEFIKYIYELAEEEEPEVVICDSPMECQKKANKINDQDKEITYSFSFFGDISDYGWVSTFDAYTQLGLVNKKTFKKYRDLFWESGVFMSLQFKGICFVSKPPVFMHKDEEDRFHCNHDYAIYFRDDYGLYFLHGRLIEREELFKKLINDNITAEEIINVNNTEVKMAFIKEYGYENLLDELDAEVLDTLGVYNECYGEEKEHEVYTFEIDGFRMNVLKVYDSSSGEVYFLGLPEDVCTVKDATIWIAGEDPSKFSDISIGQES